MTASRNLSVADVQELLNNPSPQSRATTATKIAQSFGSAILSASERDLAVDILHLLVRDAEVQVREALAENLKTNPDVPRDVARVLAADVESVSVPMLMLSKALTDEDLAEILRSGLAAKQTAIAQRENLSANVARVIAAEARPEAVTAMMANKTASIPDDAFGMALDRFSTDAAMTEAMAHRARLPVSVAERLVSLVSAAMREHLLIHHDLPAAMASDLVLQARERATVEMTWGASRDELTALVDRLHRNKRLTPTLVLRALCAGDEEFFECAMARLANIPVANARRLIQDHGDTALQRLVERCHLSHEFFTMARVALGVARDFDHDGTSADRSRVTKLIVERMASAMTEAPENENLDYLIGKLRGPDSEWERG